MNKTQNYSPAEKKAHKEGFIYGVCDAALVPILFKASGDVMTAAESQKAVKALMHLPFSAIAERLYNERHNEVGAKKLSAVLKMHKTKVVL